ncbi:decapping and exoribonuclease protein isoform X2 [Rhipicephalus microplus]|uniref:decapping and exoribonuclease protein isoform X2 n=1 Tax=Rhipicephalus microplus TaxID=6941 RepID=UPI003F6B1A4A
MAGSSWGKSDWRADRTHSIIAGDRVASMRVYDTVDWWRDESPSFGEPTEIRNFSLVGPERQYVSSPVKRKYLIDEIPLKPLWNLSRGYSTAVRRDQMQPREPYWVPEALDNLEQIASCRMQGAEAAWHERHSLLPDFVICRSSVAKLLRTPFSEEAWQFVACRIYGVVFVQHLLTHKVRDDHYRCMKDPHDDLRSYWGLKFPEYMSSSTPGTDPDVDAVLNELEEYKVVVRNSLGSHTLLMGATIKAVDPRYEPGSPKGYVVFRTQRMFPTDRQWFNFRRHKLLEWWSYSVPIGVPRVICGFRDDDGIVQSVREFQVHQMPEEARGMWSEDSCLRFLDQFLSFLKEHVREDDGRTTYNFEYDPFSRTVICTRLPDTGKRFALPNWYLQTFYPTL